MTDKEWEECADPGPMLAFLGKKVSDRKIRLFAAACCRKVWPMLTDPRSQSAVVAAENLADNRLGEQERKFARTAALDATGYGAHPEAAWAVQWLLVRKASDCLLTEPQTTDHPGGTPDAIVHAVGMDAYARAWPVGADADAARKQAESSERDRQAVLLRHIVGNPLRPHHASGNWASTVVQLATALYEGQDCSFALHDALLEAGHSDFSEHFREKEHPRGCWAVDLILKKG